ncbi:hypothetical protein [Clostridium sp. C8-1-8]|uniref:hypothetical protein n=1 Tax=Clostridium sp. C8-1-8 TaxID=2698831 RepID=UPI001371F2E0|nr:hypothetical protein [Clostridium sp. C8-1-8]
MVKKKKKIYESFETWGKSNFISIYIDMINSKAWKELNAYDITLYVYFKSKFHRKVLNGIVENSNKDNITFPKKTYGSKLDEIGYEDIMNQRTFFNSIDKLIELGFIRVVQHRWTIRESTIYGFSDMWKNYGTEKFMIYKKDRRAKGIISEEHKEAISIANKRRNIKKREGENNKVKKVKKLKKNG